MARYTQSLSGPLCEHLSIGVLAAGCPLPEVERVLRETGRESRRRRDLSAEVVMYYVIAQGLFMTASYGEVLRAVLEGMHWLGAERPRAATKGAISQARERLGAEPVRLLFERLAAEPEAQMTGSHYRGRLRVALDGSTLALQDTKENEAHFGRPPASRGKSAWPMLRFAALCALGSHRILAAQPGPYRTSEQELSRPLLKHLGPGMLCLADRLFMSYELWKEADATGAALLWRTKKNAALPVLEAFPDGSYLSEIYPDTAGRRRRAGAIKVRVIDYQLEGVADAEPLYRLVTNILDPAQAPAAELAAEYPERWDLEGCFDEIKTHLREGRKVLRSKLPELVTQEFWGLLLAHRTVRTLVVQAAQRRARDPDAVSFIHAVRVVRRKVVAAAPFFPQGS
jgi:hypothetical protein